jgi:hypothetical protein
MQDWTQAIDTTQISGSTPVDQNVQQESMQESNESNSRLTPEKKAAMADGMQALNLWTTVVNETLMNQIEKGSTIKELLQWRDGIEQMNILKQLWLLNEDVVLPDPWMQEAKEALEKPIDWSIDGIQDPDFQAQSKSVDINILQDLLEKSKKGSIFSTSNDNSVPDKGSDEPVKTTVNNEELLTLKDQNNQLQDKITSYSQREDGWMQEKQQLIQTQEELNFELRKEKGLREKFEKMASDYQTDTDLAKISDPFVRQLNDKIAQHKQQPSREGTLEILYKMNDVIKNVTGGLEISTIIDDYDKVTSWVQEVKPVNQYNYNTAKDMAQRKPQEETGAKAIIPKWITWRSV